jgi:hypothetical protein
MDGDFMMVVVVVVVVMVTTLLLDLREISIRVIMAMLVRRKQNGRHQMNYTLLNGDIRHRNGRVLVNCYQGQTMKAADVDGDGCVVEVCWEVELQYSLALS